MLPFTLRTVPGNAWPGVPRGEISQLWAMLLELEQTQWLPPPALVEGQLAQVRVLLEHCRQHVPYYQEMFERLAVDPKAIRTLADFRRLPLLQRSVYQEHYPRFQARALPKGGKPTTTLRTSGTSGMPVEIRQTNLVNLWWFVFHLRDLAWCGVDPRGELAVIRGLGAQGTNAQRALEGIRQRYWSQQLDAMIETGPAHAMDIHQEPAKQLDWLLRIQPQVLLSYPPNLDYLASLLVERGERLHRLSAILAIGETLSDDARVRIEAGFGVPVKSTYSCVEAGYLASPCPQGNGMHVHAENVLLEVLDDADQPCAPGESGRVVLTTLHNFLTPLIRYEILDGATVGPDNCPCGRGLPVLTQVLGKRRPQFRLADGRRKDSGFLVRHLRKLGAYHQHQIIQHAVDHVEVRLVPGKAWSAGHSDRVVQWVCEYFEAPIRVDVQIVSSLEMTSAGKFRDVVISCP